MDRMKRRVLMLMMVLATLSPSIVDAQESVRQTFGAWSARYRHDLMSDRRTGRIAETGDQVDAMALLQVLCLSKGPIIMLKVVLHGDSTSTVRLRFDNEAPWPPQIWVFAGTGAEKIFAPPREQQRTVLSDMRRSTRLAVEVTTAGESRRYLFSLSGLTRSLNFLQCGT